MGKMERPFDCALREYAEESLNLVKVDLRNITHIFISGKKQPHQVILFVRVEDPLDRRLESVYAVTPSKELEGVKVLTFSELKRIGFRDLAEPLKSIYPMLRSVV